MQPSQILLSLPRSDVQIPSSAHSSQTPSIYDRPLQNNRWNRLMGDYFRGILPCPFFVTILEISDTGSNLEFMGSKGTVFLCNVWVSKGCSEHWIFPISDL
jgi:hypothetical protein